MNDVSRNWMPMAAYVYYPLLFVVAYIFGCFLVSVYGPIEYVDYEKSPVAALLFFCMLSFSFGYCVATVKTISTSQRFSARRIRDVQGTLFWACISLALISAITLTALAALRGGLSLDISQSGQAYFSSYDGYERNTGNYKAAFLISTFFSFPIYLATIWGLFYFGQMSFGRRIVLIFVITSTIIVFTIGGGKQKQLGDYLIYFMTLAFIATVVRGNFTFATMIKVSIIGVFGAFCLIIILSVRYDTIGIGLNNINENIHPLMMLKIDHPVISILGDDIGFAASMFSSYLGQGFYGLSLALQQDFTWTSFAGSSYSWSVIVNRFFGLPFMVENSYPYLVGENTGWASTKWHSLYAWIASDLTYSGVVAFNAIVGYFFGKLWKEIVVCHNPFSLLLFCLLVVGAFYAPANNQLMHSPGPLATLVLTVFVYFLYGSSYNFHSLMRNRRNTVENKTIVKPA